MLPMTTGANSDAIWVDITAVSISVDDATGPARHGISRIEGCNPGNLEREHDSNNHVQKPTPTSCAWQVHLPALLPSPREIQTQDLPSVLHRLVLQRLRKVVSTVLRINGSELGPRTSEQASHLSCRDMTSQKTYLGVPRTKP